MSRARWVGLGVVGLLLGALGLGAVALARFDPTAFAPRLLAAVEARTGRAVTLSGPITLRPGLSPRVTLADLAVANRAGGSAPEMLRIGRVEVALDLFALLSGRVALRGLVLHAPDLLLETDAEGLGNWILARPAVPGSQPAAGATTPGSAGPAQAFDVDRVTITAGTLRWRDGRSGAAGSLAVPRLELARNAAGEITLAGEVVSAGVPIAVAGEAGDPSRLAAADPAGALPVALRLGAAGVAITLDARLAAAGWDATIAATIADAATLAPWWPSAPPLRAITLGAALTGGFAAAPPRLQSLRLRVGASDLGALRPGATLAGLAADLAEATVPLVVAATGTLGGVPLRLGAELGSPNLWVGDAPVPVALRLAAANATAQAEGTVTPVGRGYDLTVRGAVPAVAALAPLVGVALPALTGVTVAARIGPDADGVVLRDLAFDSSVGDAAGTVTLRASPRPGIEGSLASRRIDLVALRAAWDAAPPPPAPPAPPLPVLPTAAAPAGPAAPARIVTRVIPATPLPLATLGQADVALDWTIAALQAGGAPWSTLALRLDLGAARLRATLAGPLRASVTADAAADPPALGLDLAATGATVGRLFEQAGLPVTVGNRAELSATLRATGGDPAGLAATVTGPVTLALHEARLGGVMLAGLPRELRAALLPADAGGDLPLRCVALRAEATAGRVVVRQAIAELPNGRIGATGGIDLREERLALRLLPDLRLGQIALRAPVEVGGTLAAPRLGVSAEGAIAGGLGALLGLQRSPDRGVPASGGGECDGAVARSPGPPAPGLLQAPPAPGLLQAPPAPGLSQAPPGPGPLPAPVQDLLRGLLGR